MITENMGLVYMVAKRFANRGTDLQDLTQIGVIGLIKAIDRFDTSLSYSFSTYAVPLIMGEIRRFLRDSFSRPVTENDGKVLTLEEKLEDNHRFETPLLNHIALKQAIDQLPEEEAQLIKFRYMDNLSQAETAKRMGKNQVSVSRSERKILEKLRRKML